MLTKDKAVEIAAQLVQTPLMFMVEAEGSITCACHKAEILREIAAALLLENRRHVAREDMHKLRVWVQAQRVKTKCVDCPQLPVKARRKVAAVV